MAQEKLRRSPVRPPRSDFVQLDFSYLLLIVRVILVIIFTVMAKY